MSSPLPKSAHSRTGSDDGVAAPLPAIAAPPSSAPAGDVSTSAPATSLDPESVAAAPQLTATVVSREQHVVPDDELLQYPWRCIGRVEVAPPGATSFQNAGTGTLIGLSMVLMAAHLMKGRSFARGFRFRFVPAYNRGPQRRDPTGGVRIHAELTGRFVCGDPGGNVNEGGVYGWDFAICELSQPLGDYWGQLGLVWGGRDFYRSHRWSSVGYLVSIGGGETPIRFPGIDIGDVESDDHNSKEIETEDYTLGDFITDAIDTISGEARIMAGWSGGPLLAKIDGGWGVAGVMSGRDADDVLDADGVNVFAGGVRLNEIRRQAQTEWYGPERYTAVWRTSRTGEIQTYGVRWEAYKKQYDELWPQGWRLKLLQPYVVNDDVRYTAVWRPSSEGEIQAYGVTWDAFKQQYDGLWRQGWRSKLLQPYVVKGKVWYTAVWRPGTEGEIQAYGVSFDAFKKQYDDLWPKGWRLKLLQPYVVNGNVSYTAVWGPSSEGEIQAYGVTWEAFKQQYDGLWPQGWRLELLQPYAINGRVSYTAVWRPSNEGEIQAYGVTWEAFKKQYDKLWNEGWRLKLLQAYPI